MTRVCVFVEKPLGNFDRDRFCFGFQGTTYRCKVLRVAQVTKGRSGGSAKVKAKRRELQMKSADMLQSFSYVCRMFHFGSSRLFQHVFDDHEPNTIETDVLFKTNVETNDETTDSEDDFMSCCTSETTDSDDDYMSCCDFEEFCQEDHDTSGYMKYYEGRTGSGQSERKCRRDWTFVDPCFRMLRGFPQVEGVPMNLVCQNAQTL